LKEREKLYPRSVRGTGLFFSPKGNDDNPGTKEEPKKTLLAAYGKDLICSSCGEAITDHPFNKRINVIVCRNRGCKLRGNNLDMIILPIAPEELSKPIKEGDSERTEKIGKDQTQDIEGGGSQEDRGKADSEASGTSQE